MPVSVLEFWKLAIERGLFSAQQCERLRGKFGEVARADSDVMHLARWLVSRGLLTRFQAQSLLSGRAGPLFHGPYKIIDQLAGGLLGRSYQAVHQPTSHPVILQFPSSSRAGEVASWPEIARHVDALARLRHPCVGRVFQWYESGSSGFAVTEQPSGRSLNDRVQASGAVSPPEACRLIWQASLALEQLHQAGLVHGALRPHALWRTTAGGVLLVCDAARTPRPWKLTTRRSRGDMVVLADYFAPELAHADKTPDTLTDIYALGCTFHYLLAGRPPFPGEDVAKKMIRHTTEPVVPLRQLPGVSAEIERIVSLMMAKRADDRFSQAAIVAQQLAEVLDQRELTLQSEEPLPTLAAFEASIGAAAARPPAHEPSTVQTSPPPFSVDTSHDVGGGAGEGRADSREATLEPDTEIASMITSTAKPTVTRASLPSHRANRKPTNLPRIAALVTAAALLIAMAGYITFSGTGGDKQRFAADSAGSLDDSGKLEDDAIASQGSGKADAKTQKNLSSNSRGEISDGAEPPVSFSLVADDGQLLWAPPTDGLPISLRYVPMGAQLLLVTRPADILARTEGQKVMQGLGPRFAALRQAWEKVTGLKLQEIDQLTLALVPQNEQAPRSALVLHTGQPTDPAVLWGNRPSVTESDATIYTVDDWYVCVPATEGNRVVAMGSIEDMKQVARSHGQPPPLRRQLAQLQLVSDAERHVTLLLTRNFLFADGRKWFIGEWDKILAPLNWFLDDQIQAGMVSAHFGDTFYAEARFVSSLDVTPMQLATELKQRLQQVPARVEQHMGRVELRCWQPLAVKFPAMIRTMAGQTRAGSEMGQAVMNSVLPGPAAHNLTLATELAITSAESTSAVARREPPSSPQTIEDLLQYRMSLDIPQQSLEFALRDLAAEVRDAFPGLSFPFQLKIVGADLREEGITRNQQIKDFHRNGQTVAELLTGLVMKANPVTTVEAPTEPDQKLIWVVASDPDSPNQRTVLITTRRAAQQRGYELPRVFQAD